MTVSPFYTVPIMWETWTGNPSHLNIRYFSDSTDDNFNTIDTGVENTERGTFVYYQYIPFLFGIDTKGLTKLFYSCLHFCASFDEVYTICSS